MSAGLAFATVAGAFIFPFVLRLSWGPMVEQWGSLGGWMAAAFIVGTVWTVNHGISTPLITQTGAWVDQGLAVGVGIWVASTLTGGKAQESVKNVVSAVIGGVLAGALLSLVLG